MTRTSIRYDPKLRSTLLHVGPLCFESILIKFSYLVIEKKQAK